MVYVDESGNLNKDSFQKAMLSYRNTPDQFTKMSPAKAVFGRDVRDGMPILRGKYNPHECWKETQDNREKALARRHIHRVERWNRTLYASKQETHKKVHTCFFI